MMDFGKYEGTSDFIVHRAHLICTSAWPMNEANSANPGPDSCTNRDDVWWIE